MSLDCVVPCIRAPLLTLTLPAFVPTIQRSYIHTENTLFQPILVPYSRHFAAYKEKSKSTLIIDYNIRKRTEIILNERVVVSCA